MGLSRSDVSGLSSRETHRNRKTCAGRTPIRGRRLHEHEWSKGEDGIGSITPGPGLPGAAGFRGRLLDAGISAAPGRGRTYHLDSPADVSTFYKASEFGQFLAKNKFSTFKKKSGLTSLCVFFFFGR